MNTRQTHILGILSDRGEVAVQELADRFEVSVMTIRRDLAMLEDMGELTRTHGGAMLSKASIIEFAFKEKGAEQASSKQAIAREIASLVKPGMSMALDTGTTTLEVAKAISRVKGLTVLTSSLAIASALYARENIELVLVGGSVRRGNPDLSGWLTEENLKRFRVDWAVLGADGADPDGVYTTDVNIARVCQAMMAGAKETVLVLDHTKLERTAFVKYASWDEIGRVITDDAAARSTRKWLGKAVKNVTYAKT